MSIRTPAWFPRTLVLTSLFVVAALATPAGAGERTATLSSFDDGDMFDASIEAEYRYGWTMAKINRERVCIASQSPGSCAENSILLAKELNYSRATQWLDLTSRIGLYKDLDVFFVLPMWLSDQTRYRYQSGVSADVSTIDPRDTPSSFLFKVPNDGPNRSGLGDLRFGIRWQPFSQARDPEEANWRLSNEITLPTASVRAGGNKAVGDGLASWRLATTVSRRFFGVVEPYFETHGLLRFPTASSLFKDYGEAQNMVDPGHQIGLKIGVEFIPWERPSVDRVISIDVGLGADYMFEGRAYSELFEALANSSCTYPTCDQTTSKQGLTADGLTDISHYGAFETWVHINFQFIEYVQFKLGFDYGYEKSHFITNADAGKDLNLSGLVDQPNEFNPVYNENIDKVGSRFIVDGVNRFLISVALAFKI